MRGLSRYTPAMTDVSESLPYKVAAYYCFANVPDPAALRDELLAFGAPLGVIGSTLLAHEGVNGTMAGEDAAIDAWIAHLRAIPGCADMDVKYSRAADKPFGKFKVRLKKEIVTLAQDGVDPVGNVGVHVEPQDWNALISDPDVVVIDTRNFYEVSIGTFKGALDPETQAFRDFPEWFDARAAQWKSGATPKKIAMFCTGGIRCEKSTAFVRARGFDDVYHLKGGILNYLEHIPESDSLWEGGCYVFDDRVSLGHGLKQGEHVSCDKCGWPSSKVAHGPDHVCPHAEERAGEGEV
jgi:UPF0176 protein